MEKWLSSGGKADEPGAVLVCEEVRTPSENNGAEGHRSKVKRFPLAQTETVLSIKIYNDSARLNQLNPLD